MWNIVDFENVHNILYKKINLMQIPNDIVLYSWKCNNTLQNINLTSFFIQNITKDSLVWLVGWVYYWCFSLMKNNFELLFGIFFLILIPNTKISC